MGISLLRNSKKNIEKLESLMNYKKLVQEIYPYAFLFEDIDDCRIMKFLILNSVNKKRKRTLRKSYNPSLFINYKPVGFWSDTEKCVWKNAYESIQNDILDKLVQ
jgi:hypothetical protein